MQKMKRSGIEKSTVIYEERFASTERWIPRLIMAIIVIVIISTSLPAAIPEESSLQGRVFDGKTREPLEGVMIRVVEIDKWAVSDRTGFYRIESIPLGRYSVEFVLEGFKKLVKTDITITSHHVTRLHVELDNIIPRLHEEVTVTARNLPSAEATPPSRVTLDAKETTTIPGSFRDLSRVLKVIPGTSHMTEKANDLIVRGGSPWENGFFIDNIQIPNLNHFQLQGNAGGAFGLLNLSLVQDIDIYTGGFAAAYGNQMSSITDITLREGTRDRVRSQFFIHLTGFGLTAEGPVFGNRGAWLFSLNRSYHDLILNIVNYRGVIPRFGDLHFKLVFDIGSNNRIQLLNIFGNSRVSYDLEKAVEQGLNSYLDFITNQNTLGMNWLSSWSHRGHSNTSLSYSYFKNTYSATAVRPEAGTSDLKAVEEFNGEFHLRNVNSYRFSQKHRVRFGFEINPERFEYDNYVAEYINHWGSLIPEFIQKGTMNTSKHGLFFSYLFSPWDSLTFSIGGRTDYFAFNKHLLFSPRISVSWEIRKGLSLRGAWGNYIQSLPVYLLSGSPENALNKDPVASHIVLGLGWELDPSTSIKLDIYHKSYKNLPLTPEDPSNFVADSGLDFGLYRAYAVLSDSGIARSQGIELLFQKKSTRGFFGILSISLFRSRFRDFNGIWRNRINDNRYILTWTGGYKPNEKWTFLLFWNWAGGRPYTPYDLELSKEYKVSVINRDEVYAKRYPDYMTFNIRIDRRFSFKKSSLNVFLGVSNLFNRKNLDRYFWNKIENNIDTIYQGPLLPEFGVEFRF